MNVTSYNLQKNVCEIIETTFKCISEKIHPCFGNFLCITNNVNTTSKLSIFFLHEQC